MALIIKTQPQIRDDILRTLSNGLRGLGISAPNVGPASDYYYTASGFANECAIAQANSAIGIEAIMPDTAVGDRLDAWLNLFNIPRRPASKSTGRGIFATTSATSVIAGAQLYDQFRQRYEVVTGGIYASGDYIDVRSVGTGTAANLAGGTVLKWVSPPPYAAQTMPLDSDGTDGGAEAEDVDTARARLLDYLADPPGSGNSAQVAASAEAVGAFVQKAFVYPAANGPGTLHVAVCGPATASTSRSRKVAAANVTLASNAVIGDHPDYAEIVVTSVVDSPADVSFDLQLPTSSSAGANGVNGWVDAIPWPVYYGTSTKYASVSVVTSTTDITIANCDAVPTVGASICWVDSSFTLRTAKVLTNPSNTGVGPYACRVTLDTPLVGIAVGQFVFPAAVNGSNYLAALLDAFAAMGPGEKVSAAGLLPRAYRKPRYFESWDYTLGAKVLRALSDAGSEVLDVAWAHQNGGTTTPALPASISDGPAVFTPRKLAWYPA